MKILVMCNPYSGKGKSVSFANKLKNEFASRGETDVFIFESQSIDSLHDYFKELKQKNEKFDAAVFLGGDGTFGIAVDAMFKAGLSFPVAIFPLGTVNDFSRQIGMKQNVKKCVDVVLSGKTEHCDVATCNGDYVVNVACGGYFTHGATTYSKRAKKLFGKMAYYGKAVFSVMGMHPQKLKITVDGKEFKEDILMYLIMNSRSAGGFNKVGVDASIDDGYFDLCALKRANFFSLAHTFFRVLEGKHKNNKNIIYAKGKHFEVDLAENSKKKKINSKFIKSDMDGNIGPELPLKIDVIQKQLEVFVGK